MYNIENILLFNKMAKEMNVSCDILTNPIDIVNCQSI